MDNDKLIIGLKDANKFLYHYTGIDVAKDHILRTRSLMANSYSSTNDPKESKQWEFSLGTNESRDLGQYNMSDLSKQFSEALKLKTKLVCFSSDQTPLSGNHMNDIFKRGFCKPRMWAQYSGNHTGVCLVFDRSKLDTAISSSFGNSSLVFNGDVRYLDRSVVGSLHEGDYKINVDSLEKLEFNEYVTAHFKTFYSRLFFEKMIDWSHETEFRWVIAADKGGPLFFDYQDALVGICFGDSTSEEHIDQIIEMTKNEIMYTGLKWTNCSPWYDLVNPKYDKALSAFFGKKDS